MRRLQALLVAVLLLLFACFAEALQLNIRAVTSASAAADKTVRAADDILIVNPTTGPIALTEGTPTPSNGQAIWIRAGAATTAENTVSFAGHTATNAGTLLKLIRVGGVWVAH